MFEKQHDRRAYQLEFLLQAMWPEGRGGGEASADPTSSGPLHRHDLAKPPRILFGRVIEGVAYTHFYRVQVENGMSTLPCVAMGHTSFAPLGAKQLNNYLPGTAVYLLYSPDTWFGVILGAEPDFSINPTHSTGDYIVQGSRVGLQADDLHKIPFQLSENGTVVDWSAGRPADSLPAGEWGAITETGLRFFLDSFMAGMSADEVTGVWAFYFDQMLRLSGHNMQQRAFGTDREYLDDVSEHHTVERQASYPWEAMGNVRRAQGPWHLEWTPEQTQQQFPWLGKYEPWFDDQQGMHRLETFYGYLGSACKRILKLPPQEQFGDPVRFKDKVIYPGVFEETVLLTGQLNLRSAKAVVIAKELRIPSPKQMKRPEDPAGDNETNYNPDGCLRAEPGLRHNIKDGPSLPATAENPSLVRAAALLDTLAYTLNYEGVVPFHYHTGDWYLPEEGVLASGPPEGAEGFGGTAPESRADLTDAVPAYYMLDAAQFLLPQSVELEVDERYGNATYYRNGSRVMLHDDGTVSITAAFGEQILMTGGNVYVDAPGDVWIRSGKNFNVWSGFDSVIKANNSVDVTASKGDLRLKADRNLQVLGGLSGEGAVLLESKAVCSYHDYYQKYGEDVVSSGVVLRADKSQVIAIAQDMVLTNNCPSVATPGNLLVDFGAQKVVTKSGLFERYLDTAIDFLGNGVANEWWSTGAVIGSPLSVLGETRVVDGYLSVDGWIYSTEHIGTARADEFNNMVGQETPSSITSVEAEFTHIRDRATALEAYRVTAVQDLVFRDGMCDAHFSFRTPDQYKTTLGRCTVHEAYWQQVARLAAQSLPKWEEPTLTMGDGKKLQPFPGYEEWETSTNLLQQDLTLYSVPDGKRVDRDAYPTDPEYAAPARQVLKDNYPTIRSV